jgi:hypothetical protein
MHAANDYLNAWVELANKNNLLLVAPEFENKFEIYNKRLSGRNFLELKPKSEWTYSHRHIRHQNELTVLLMNYISSDIQLEDNLYIGCYY